MVSLATLGLVELLGWVIILASQGKACSNSCCAPGIAAQGDRYAIPRYTAPGRVGREKAPAQNDEQEAEDVGRQPEGAQRK
jgi:hypothetical protein